MRIAVSRIVSVLVLFFLTVTCLSASSVSATGVVHSTSVNSQGVSLKIERPDESKVNALCEDGLIAFECAIAEGNEPAWGRASCSGGACIWSCLDVDYGPSCQSWQQFEFNDAKVIGKELCAGELYMTVLLANNTDEIVAHCEGAQMYAACQNVAINQTVHVIVDFGCNVEKNWILVE